MNYKLVNTSCDLLDVYTYLMENGLQNKYSFFTQWFFDKIMNNNDRFVIALYDREKIAGVCIGKRSSRKLCTFFISKEYRGLGWKQIMFNVLSGLVDITHYTSPSFFRINKE